MKKKAVKGWFSKEKMFPLIIIIIMTSSVIGLMWGRDSSTSINYKDFKFLRQNNQWVLKTKEISFVFDFFPSDVESILISDEIKNRLKNTVEMDITYDLNSSYIEDIAKAQYSIEENLGKLNVYIRKGFTSNNTYNMPVITCKDSTDIVPVIYFKDSNNTGVYLEDNCIIAESSSDIDFIRIKDRLLYSFTGIID